MKKTVIKVAVLSLMLSLLFMQCSFASERTPYNWYCKNNDTHTPPTLDKGISFIEKYDAYYLNKKATDSDKVIYLTFDAGYENGNVAKILDTLKAHNAKAAFFVLENIIARAPEVVKRMDEEGHTVCNHTKSHPDMTAITDKSLFEKQLTALSDKYYEVTGKEMAKIYRPPQGRFSEENLKFAKELGYKTLFWSFAYADWDNDKQPSPEWALEKILSHLHNGEVMLLHPNSATNAEILDKLLCEIEAQGYRIGDIEEIWK